MAYKLLLVSDFDPAELARIDLTGVSSHEAAVERIQRHSLGWSWCHQQAFQELGVACSTLIPASAAVRHHWQAGRAMAAAPTDRPHDLPPPLAYVLEAVRAERPDVLLLENPAFLDARALTLLRDQAERPRLVTHLCAALPPAATATLAFYDLVLCCSPHFLTLARTQGARVTLHYHAAPPAALELPPPPLASRLRRACFAGSIVAGSRYHARRLRLLRQACRAGVPIDLFSAPPISRPLAALKSRGGGGASRLVRGLEALEQRLTAGSPLRKALRPPVYGQAMFHTLQRYICTVNVHAGMAQGFAANMRLFEAAALGVCLISEDHPNLNDLFTPEREILTYRTGQDLIQRLRFCIDHPEAAGAIGERARERALQSHRYAHRATVLHGQLLDLLGRNG
ncbi:MAG: glycosyltransferase [Cyanobacteriota bacterium]|nr:glycosyltransferase [Cyanobacteriota bacterium]